jgi:hypothetical protein
MIQSQKFEEIRFIQYYINRVILIGKNQEASMFYMDKYSYEAFMALLKE